MHTLTGSHGLRRSRDETPDGGLDSLRIQDGGWLMSSSRHEIAQCEKSVMSQNREHEAISHFYHQHFFIFIFLVINFSWGEFVTLLLSSF